MKRVPRPRNLIARDMHLSGACRPKSVPVKIKTLPRKRKHKKDLKDEKQPD